MCDKKMKTILQPRGYVEKSVNISNKVHHTLTMISEQYNRKVSRGVVAYEALLMFNEEYTDMATELEERVNKEFAQVLRDYNLEVDHIDYQRNEFDAELEMIQTVPEEYDAEDIVKRVKIRIPKCLDEQLEFSRGWNKRLEKALRNYIGSRWDSRLERVEVKQEIIDYVEKGEIPEHEIARVMCNCVTTGSYPGLPRLDKKTNLITNWESYIERGEELTGWEERFEALARVWENSDMTRDGMVTLIQKTHDIGTEQYAREQIEELGTEYDIDELKHRATRKGVSKSNKNVKPLIR